MDALATKEIERKREDGTELAKLLIEKVPANKRERILGIIEGAAMFAEGEKEAV